MSRLYSNENFPFPGVQELWQLEHVEAQTNKKYFLSIINIQI